MYFTFALNLLSYLKLSKPYFTVLLDKKTGTTITTLLLG